jgi:ubiquinone/menaquinone biosynthesis C-methylase UbiE
MKRAYDATAAARAALRWRSFETATQQVSARLIELADVREGYRILDVATGTGEPGLTAARKAGPHGHIVATDLSREMLAVARARAAESALSNIDFLQLDADALCFPPASFDAALSRWALMYLTDVRGTLCELGEILVSGGRLAIAVLGARENSSVSLTVDVVRQALRTPALPADTPDAFRFADESILADLLRETGWRDVATERLAVRFSFASAQDYAQWCAETQAPILGLLAHQPPQQRRDAIEAIVHFAQQRSDANGAVHMSLESVLAVGTRVS